MNHQKKKKLPSKLNTIDCVLIGCASFLIIFTCAILIIFILFQTEPDTLITSVFGLLGGEKRYARKYEEEDRVNDAGSIYKDNDSDI